MLKKREPKKASSQENAFATTITPSRRKSVVLQNPRMFDPFVRVDPKLLERIHKQSLANYINKFEEALF
jgi:hypothetical protein